MNAPYDGDRGQAVDGSGHHDAPPPEHGQQPQQPPADMYLQDAYSEDPYRAQDLTAQDPVGEALYDRAAHPPPPPGTYGPQQPLYGSPPQSPYAPDPRLWAQTPPPEPSGATQYLPYGEDPRTTQFVGVDDLVSHSGEEHHEPDAFAHLFRDQQQGGYQDPRQSGYQDAGQHGYDPRQSGYQPPASGPHAYQTPQGMG
ncbi:murein biosynthesis integral membrane protein MurJ, partial [Streptomyces carpinensis]